LRHFLFCAKDNRHCTSFWHKTLNSLLSLPTTVMVSPRRILTGNREKQQKFHKPQNHREDAQKGLTEKGELFKVLHVVRQYKNRRVTFLCLRQAVLLRSISFN
jgi:hypothetical protein